MTPPPTQFHLRTPNDPPHPSAPLIGELSAQLTEGLSYPKNLTPPVCFAASSLRRARSAALTVHRTVIHYRRLRFAYP